MIELNKGECLFQSVYILHSQTVFSNLMHNKTKAKQGRNINLQVNIHHALISLLPKLCTKVG